MIALIGKNGAGKTQLLTTLPLEIAKEKSELLSPHKPIYWTSQLSLDSF
jgi:ABC-type phosphate/phosphonate transport system ATPase subunit